ncbi:MAG: hypothetical protein HQL97_15505 [Magnetococcales bacterium]|nr:hypothetical protein [Magnetococcales bacterium]
METHEQRVNKIPETRFYACRRLVCQCMRCAGVVFIKLTPTKAEVKARRNFRRRAGRQMGKALSAAVALHQRWIAQQREGALGPK